MTILDWVPSTATAALIGVIVWLARNLIITRLTAAVQHEFDSKLEAIRASHRQAEERLRQELRSAEASLASLRSSALDVMTRRTAALEQRRLLAIEQLWSGITALGPARFVVSMMGAIHYDKVAELAERDPRVNQFFALFEGAEPDLQKLASPESVKARPFVSPLAWALFSAYQAIVWNAVVKFQMLKGGLGKQDWIKKDELEKLVRAALPHQEAFIEKFGDSAFHLLLEELESLLLDEFRAMQSGAESDRATLERASQISKLSEDLLESTSAAVREGDGSNPTPE